MNVVQTQIVMQSSEVFTDAGLWPMTMTDAAGIEIVTRGTAVIQNKSGPFLHHGDGKWQDQRLHKVINNWLVLSSSG